MKTGFYNIKKLSNDQLKAFYKDAVMLSYDTHIEILDCEKTWRRERSNEKTISEMIEESSTSYHNICIDRSVQMENEKYGEVGYCSLNTPDYFLYIFVTLDNLKLLADKYGLEMN